MKYFTILLISILYSCQHPKDDDKYFFDFNQIDHYHIDFKKEKMKRYQDITNSNEKLYYDILRFDYPENIDDKNFIEILSKYYDKKVISPNKFNKIREIYKEKIHSDRGLYACAPFYRDILVFKKSGKIIGISKVCFECGLHRTIGSKKNTEDLGMSGDFEKLMKILK